MPGKHAPESSASFYLSLSKAVGAALAAVAVMSALVIVLLGREEANPNAGPAIESPRPTVSRTPTSSPTASPSLLPVSRVTVDVLNGTTRARLARSTADTIEQEGYRIRDVGNATRTDKSTIFYRPGRRAEALAFQRDFPAFTVIEEGPSSQRTILRVVLGADWPRV